MKSAAVLLTISLCVSLLPATRARQLPSSDPLTPRLGDRLVILGSTLAERETWHGFWELAVLRHGRGPWLTVRNLGWSGDTVWGEARAGFGGPADGYKRLLDQTREFRPTMILLAYGSNEAYAGANALPRFREGLVQLCRDLTQPPAAGLPPPRLVFMTPPQREYRPPPVPPVASFNRDLGLYADVIRAAARERQAALIDLYSILPQATDRELTENGLHLNAEGYWRSAAAVEAGLGLKAPAWSVLVDMPSRTAAATGCSIRWEESAVGLRFAITEACLMLPAPAGVTAVPPRWDRTIVVRGLPRGEHRLRVAGRVVLVASAEQWARGVQLPADLPSPAASALKAAVAEKNRLVLQRWRPANDVYLFGFRKHEQGQNAGEVAALEPLITAADRRVGELLEPRPLDCTLEPN